MLSANASIDSGQADRRRRILRFQAVVLAAVMSGFAIWSTATIGPHDRNGQLKAADFAHFYVLAHVAHEKRFDEQYRPGFLERQTQVLLPWFPRRWAYPAMYPPQLGIVLGPLARLPYWTAVAAWIATSLGLYLVSVVLLTRGSPSASVVRWFAVANPAFFATLLSGQLSAIATLQVTLAWLSWKRDRLFLAGFCLGSLAWKPSLLAITSMAVVVAPRLWLVTGIVAAIAVQVAAVSIAADTWWPAPVWRGYLDTTLALLLNPIQSRDVLHLQSIRGSLGMLLGDSPWVLAGWVSLGAVFVALTWRNRAGTDPRVTFASIVIAGLMLSPHVYVYDMLVLSVALALLASFAMERLAERRHTGVLAYLLHVWPLVPSPLLFGVQLTPLLALALMVWPSRKLETDPAP